MNEDKIRFSDGINIDEFVKKLIMSGISKYEQNKSDTMTFYLYSQEKEIFVEIHAKEYGYQVVSVLYGDKAKKTQEFLESVQYMEFEMIEV